MIPKTHLIESLQVTKEHALPPQHNKHYQLSIGCHLHQHKNLSWNNFFKEMFCLTYTWKNHLCEISGLWGQGITRMCRMAGKI